MREKVYRGLVSTPGIALGFINTAAGLFGTFGSEEARNAVGGIMNADTIQAIGISMLAVSVFYFVALWLLKPTVPANAQEGAKWVGQTAGDSAKQYQGDFRGAQFNEYNAPPNPAAVQPPKSPYGAARPLEPPTSPKVRPDMDMYALLTHLYHVIPKPNPDPIGKAYEEKVRNSIVDTVCLEELSVWGRFCGRPPLMPIEIEVWQNAHLSPFQNRLQVFRKDGTSYDFTDLHFLRTEVEAAWPKGSSQ